MIRNLKPWAILGLFFLFVSLSSATPGSKETTIYIVRHAEKDTSNSKNSDPGLNNEGKERVKALNKFLKKETISAVFSTNYKRTIQTVAPVAQRNGLPLKTYEANEPMKIVQLIKSEFLNHKTLIVGHSNTILELIKAFGVTPPFNKLNDNDYDLIFMITINKTGDTSLIVRRFGKSHHSTEISETLLN